MHIDKRMEVKNVRNPRMRLGESKKKPQHSTTCTAQGNQSVFCLRSPISQTQIKVAKERLPNIAHLGYPHVPRSEIETCRG